MQRRRQTKTILFPRHTTDFQTFTSFKEQAPRKAGSKYATQQENVSSTNSNKLGEQLCTLETATSKLPRRTCGRSQAMLHVPWPTEVHPKYLSFFQLFSVCSIFCLSFFFSSCFIAVFSFFGAYF